MEEGRNYKLKWVVWETYDNLDKTEDELFRKPRGRWHWLDTSSATGSSYTDSSW